MKSVIEEIKKYRYSALEASITEDRALAKQWRMAADQAYNFYLQQQWKEPIPPSSLVSENSHAPVPLRALSLNYQVHAIRKQAHSMLQASQAFEQQQHELAQRLVTTTSAIREAAACYHYWIAQAKEGSYQTLPCKIAFSLEKAEHFRLKAFEATQANNPELAQNWAEAACLLQEAARKFTMTQRTYHNKLRPLATDYWRVSAHAAYHAANFQMRVAELSFGQQKELALEWREAALLADHAMVLKANAARIHSTHEAVSIDLSLAGYWMALASDIKVFLIKTSSQKVKSLLWEKAFAAVENIANIYQKVLSSKEDNQKQSYRVELIASAEDAADRAILLAEKELE